MQEKVYNYIRNLRLNSPRHNYLIQRRRVDKGNGSKTLGWLLYNENNELVNENIKFNNIIEYKRKLENV